MKKEKIIFILQCILFVIVMFLIASVFVFLLGCIMSIL